MSGAPAVGTPAASSSSTAIANNNELIENSRARPANDQMRSVKVFGIGLATIYSGAIFPARYVVGTHRYVARSFLRPPADGSPQVNPSGGYDARAATGRRDRT